MASPELKWKSIAGIWARLDALSRPPRRTFNENFFHEDEAAKPAGTRQLIASGMHLTMTVGKKEAAPRWGRFRTRNELS
jgi:hypothetical protein